MPISNVNPQQRDVVIYQRDDTNSYWGEAHISGSNLIFYIDAQGHINADNSASFYSLFPPSSTSGGSGTTLVTGGLYPITASWAISASWAPGGTGGSGTTLVTGGLYQITASWALNAGTTLITGALYPITASWSQTSSWAVNVINALISTVASSSLFASSSVSSSYVDILTTASNAEFYVPFVMSSSYQRIFIDPGSIFYNPGTDTLRVNNISASSVTASLFGTASQAAVAGLVVAIPTSGIHTVGLLGSNSGVVNVYADNNDNIRWDVNNQILYAQNLAGTASLAISASHTVASDVAKTLLNDTASVDANGNAIFITIQAGTTGQFLVSSNGNMDNLADIKADTFTSRNGVTVIDASSNITSHGNIVTTQNISASRTITATTVSASLYGTASWAVNVVSSSNSLTASYVTASNVFGTVGNATNAGFANQAVQATSSLSASYITASNVVGIVPTASVALNANSASVATTASFALNFNPSATASFANNAGTASLANTASYAFTASFMNASMVFISSSIQNNNYTYWTAISGSGQAFTLVTSSNIIDSGSFAFLTGTASWAQSASNALSALTATTASFALNFNPSATASNAQSSSVAQTASYVLSTEYIQYLLDPTSFVTSGQTLPAARGSQNGLVVGNKIYLYGGRTSGGSPQNNIYTASVDAPEFVRDSGATLPIGMGWNAGRIIVVSSSIYWYGGVANNGSTTGSIFTASLSDPLTWVNSGVTMSVPLVEQNVWINGNIIYQGWGATPSRIYTASISNPLVFDVGTPVFTASQLSIVQVDNKLYALGGQSLGNSPSVNIFTASATSPFTWYSASTVIPGGSPNAVVAIGNNFYSFGGYTGGTGQSAEIYQFTPSNNPPTASDLGLTTGQANFSNVNIVTTASNGRPYLVMYGGSTGDSSAGRTTIITASISRISASQADQFSYINMHYWERLVAQTVGSAQWVPFLAVNATSSISSSWSRFAVTASTLPVNASFVITASAATSSSFASRALRADTANAVTDESGNPILTHDTANNVTVSLASISNVMTIRKNGGANVGIPNDTNAALIIDTGNNSTNVWFNVGTGGPVNNATWGWTQGTQFRHGLIWVKPTNVLAISSDGASAYPTGGLFMDGNSNISIQKRPTGSYAVDIFGNVAITGSLNISGSLTTSVPIVVNTASFASIAQTASYVSAANVDGTVATSSWALNVVNVTMDIIQVQVFS